MTRISVLTQGCKLNQYESELIVELLENAGFVVLTVEDPLSSVYIINTCAVTSEAERKVRQTVRHLRRLNPNSKIILVGCYAHAHRTAEEYNTLGVDLVLGNHEKKQILNFLNTTGLHAKADYWTEDDISYELVQSSVFERSRAFVKVEDGCNNGCTYCVLRELRGTRVRSKPVETVLIEIDRLVQRRHREIVLTGLNLGKYGTDLDVSLTELLKKIESIDGEFRIRLSSINPEDVTDTLIEFIKSSPRICNHLHIPIQSGSNEVLRRMGRKYDVEKLRRIVGKLREFDEHFSITTDIIVGFPGESERNFEETLSLIEELKFSRVHAFRFSPRPGTRAAELEEQVPGNVKKTRAEILIKHARKVAVEYRRNLIGRTMAVLVEGKVGGLFIGYDEYYNHHETNAGVVGEFSKVQICSVTDEGVLSKVVREQVSNE